MDDIKEILRKYVGREILVRTKRIQERGPDYLTSPCSLRGILERIDDSGLHFLDGVVEIAGKPIMGRFGEVYSPRRGKIHPLAYEAIDQVSVVEKEVNFNQI